MLKLFLKTVTLAIPSCASGLLLVLISVSRWDESPILSFVSGLLFLGILRLFDWAVAVVRPWEGDPGRSPTPGLLPKTHVLTRSEWNASPSGEPWIEDPGLAIGEFLFGLECIVAGLVSALSVLAALLMISNSVALLVFHSDIVSWAFR